MHILQNLVRTLGCFALAACSVSHYRVEMSLVAGGLRREVTCWSTSPTTPPIPTAPNTPSTPNEPPPFPAHRLAQVARAYGRTPPLAATSGPERFAGTFTLRTPDDVEGAGMLLPTTTSMGTVWKYVERFRGSDDPAADLRGRFWAMDRLAELISAWFGKELGGRPGWQPLKDFLDGPFRRDLKNIVLLATGPAAVEMGRAPIPADIDRLLIFALEREYVRPAEVQSLASRGLDLPEALLTRMVARRMGVPDREPIPPILQFLEGERHVASFRAFAASSPEFPRLWDECASALPGLGLTGRETHPERLLTRLLLIELMDIEITPDQERVEVSIASGVEPLTTNGVWRPAEGRIHWPEATMHDRGPGLLRHATWAAPEEAFQKAKLGRVILSGQALADYVAWCAALEPAHAIAWNQAITALPPAGDAAAIRDAVRGLPDLGESEEGPLGRSLLLKALDEPK